MARSACPSYGFRTRRWGDRRRKRRARRHFVPRKRWLARTPSRGPFRFPNRADWCERGLKIVAITQQIELNGAVGRMIVALLLGLAEIELEYRQERQTAGIEVAKRKGTYNGRQKGTTKAEPSRAGQSRAKGWPLSRSPKC